MRGGRSRGESATPSRYPRAHSTTLATITCVRSAPSDGGITVGAISPSIATASGVRSRGWASTRSRSNGRTAAAEANHWSSVRRFIGLPPRQAENRNRDCYSEEMEWVMAAWGRILAGYTPALSIEITRECPLRCPGCYAYGDDHLGGDLTLRELRDFKGQELIDGMAALIDRHRPLHVSIVGGEPLVRYRELNVLLPMLAARGIHVQLVTSAVREIPPEWHGLPRLSIVVSIDGLQPEHDARRTPATYDRILKHIGGHDITVHCTVTRQQVNRAGYLEEFLRFWSAKEETTKIWMSLYTPQVGETSAERLSASDRRHVVSDLMAL